MKAHLRGLYAITDPGLTPADKLLDKASQVLMGGARLLQYRNKNSDDLSTNHLLDLLALCNEHDALLIINDDVELAKRIRAHGIHIGKDDAALQHAREYLGTDTIIGVSCYNQLELAVNAQTQGADYVAFGSFFASSVKPEAVRADVELLVEARERISIPICAIGGITANNARPLVAAGADMVAVISDVFGGEDVLGAAQRFSSLFEFS